MNQLTDATYRSRNGVEATRQILVGDLPDCYYDPKHRTVFYLHRVTKVSATEKQSDRKKVKKRGKHTSIMKENDDTKEVK